MIHSYSHSVVRSLLALTLLAGSGFLATPARAATGTGASPDKLWQLQAGTPAARSDREPFIEAKRFQAFTADLPRLRATLATAPLDKTTAEAAGITRTGAPVEISLPMPKQGKIARFRVVEVSIMEAALAARYPLIKTYRGVGIDDPSATLALDLTPSGMHAQIMSPAGWVYISPYYFGGADDLYASYFKKNVAPDSTYPWVCEFRNDLFAPVRGKNRAVPETTFSGSLRTYRLACAANHNYVATTGGTKASGVAAVVTVINRVSAIYESEVGIRLVLIANNDAVIYPDAATDPYANDTAALDQNTSNLNAVIGSANYDIGHVFTTGSGGVAGLGVVCQAASKGRGTTGLGDPKGDTFNVDFVAHEMGHQFGGNHTFNGNTGNCSGNRSAAHAYEPGSGSTIMAYAGICAAASDLQPHSDAYFHSESIMEILTYAGGANGGSCPVVTTNADSAPTVNAGADYVIPISTPFALTGSGTDPDGDILTYCWEERDRGAAQAATAADNGLAPILRSFTPVYTPVRTFPKVSDLLNNTITIGEKLPALARVMNFRLTVRDNRAGGGATNSDDAVVTVSAAAGPFVVTSPNTAVTATAGTPLNVTWNVANTTLAPVSTAAVNILLSVDGGYTYPITLAANTANDGTEVVTLPAGVKSTSARIKVAAANSVYFDISDVNFTIN